MTLADIIFYIAFVIGIILATAMVVITGMTMGGVG